MFDAGFASPCSGCLFSEVSVSTASSVRKYLEVATADSSDGGTGYGGTVSSGIKSYEPRSGLRSPNLKA